MLKRLVLVLDGSQAGRTARTYALNLAKHHHAEILGAAVLDTPWLTAPQPEPLGGSAFKVRADEEMVRFTQSHIEELMSEFKSICEKEKNPFQVLEIEGFPANEIEIVSYQGDLIVLGRTTDFHFALDEDSDNTVKHIAHDNPRPLIMVPEIPAKTNTIMVAYDGEIQSARALHMFLLLNLGKGKNLHIVNVNEDSKEGEDIISLPLKLCEVHGVPAKGKILQPKHSIAETLLEFSKEIKAEMIVLGAFGHTLIRDVFFGSCSKMMLKNSSVPLFIHH
jgi:nucleotide-binding universal stress UspA family protein